MRVCTALIGLLAAIGAPRASAEPLRDFCPDRPGLGTPACTVDEGHVAIELGIVDWTIERAAGQRTDTSTGGDLLVRYGLGSSLEAQLGWQALGVVRERSLAGNVDRTTGTGDIRVGLRKNLLNPDGSGLSIAVMPFVTLPTGGAGIGERDWTAGLIVPVSYGLSEKVQVAFTGELNHAANGKDGGHHLAYSGVVGIEAAIGRSLSATLEWAAERDEEEPGTELVTGLSLAWLASPSLQLDAGANIGLNGRAADVELYLGIARRF